MKCDPNKAQLVESVRVSALPTPGHRIDLASMTQVRREMARVYKEVRHQRLPSSEGARLVFMLSQIAKAIELAELEARLAKLEELTWVPSRAA